MRAHTLTHSHTASHTCTYTHARAYGPCCSATPPPTVRAGGDEGVVRDHVGAAPLAVHAVEQLQRQVGAPRLLRSAARFANQVGARARAPGRGGWEGSRRVGEGQLRQALTRAGAGRLGSG
jgi:hypothetical protein